MNKSEMVQLDDLKDEEQLGNHIKSKLSSIKSLSAAGIHLNNLMFITTTISLIDSTLWAMCPAAFGTSDLSDSEYDELLEKLKNQVIKETETFLAFMEADKKQIRLQNKNIKDAH